MKTNQIYVVVAVVIIILGLVMWNRNKTEEVADQAVETSTSTPASTQNSNTSVKSTSVQKPVPAPINTSTSKPAEAPTQEPVPSVPTNFSLKNFIYRMTSYNGSVVPADSRYTLTFENGVLNAKFCNSMSGNFVLDGSLIKVSNVTSTQMYCATPSNLMEIESAFVSMLNFGGIIYQSGNKIILSRSNGTIMVFTGF